MLSAQVLQALLALATNRFDEAVQRKTLLHIADNVGIVVAARETSPIAAAVRQVFGGPGANPGGEAFSLSAYGHILDFDDIHDVARVHPTAVTLPAALAAARCTPARGATVLLAVALGNELLCRLGCAWRPVGRGPGADWFLTQLFGYFAAALAAAIVLGLDEAQVTSALGLAYMQAAGGKEAGFGVGSNARAIYTAFAAHGGMQAALLARAGIVGPPGAFDGEAGLFPLYFGRQLDAAQRDQLLDRTEWAWTATQIKPWPSCRHSHPCIHAALALRPGLELAALERVQVSVNRSSGRLCAPIEERRAPRTLQDAKYSIPFMTAFALRHGEVTLSNLTEAALRDESVLALAQRVYTDETTPDEPGLPRTRVSISSSHLGQGRSFEGEFAFQPDTDAVRRKFMDCFAYAGLSPLQASGAWRAVEQLPAAGPGALLDMLSLAQSPVHHDQGCSIR